MTFSPPGTLGEGEYVLADPHPLGKGGFGAVYKYRQPQLRRLVAVKFALPGAKSPPVDVEEEAARLGQLGGHQNIVPVYAVLPLRGGERTTRAGVAIVMEYVRGEVLSAFVGCPQAPADVLHWLDRLASGASHAHSQGILHRDLKPHNIIIRETSGLGEPVILDFGISMMAAEAGFRKAGTRAYKAPEQDSEPTEASDFWPLGLMAFELSTHHRVASLAGGIPEPERSPLAVRDAVLARIDAVDSTVLRGLIDRLLVPDPSERISSVARLRDALDEERAHIENGVGVNGGDRESVELVDSTPDRKATLRERFSWLGRDADRSERVRGQAPTQADPDAADSPKLAEKVGKRLAGVLVALSAAALVTVLLTGRGDDSSQPPRKPGPSSGSSSGDDAGERPAPGSGGIGASARASAAKTSPRVKIRVHKWWAGETDLDTQIKVNVSLRNKSSRTVNVEAGPRSRIILGVPKHGLSRAWLAPSSQIPRYEVYGPLLLIRPNLPGAVTQFPPAFATYWTKRRLAPGERWYRAGSPERSSRDGDLVFSVPEGLGYKVQLGYKTPGHDVYWSTTKWPTEQTDPLTF